MPAIENEYVASKQKKLTRICIQCGEEKQLKCFQNGRDGKKHTLLCHSCRAYNRKRKLHFCDINMRCQHCAHMEYCNTAVWEGKRLPCQPKREEDIRITVEKGDLVKAWV
jgi:hypothetical protein